VTTISVTTLLPVLALELVLESVAACASAPQDAKPHAAQLTSRIRLVIYRLPGGVSLEGPPYFFRGQA
jgi:hypothetical protein